MSVYHTLRCPLCDSALDRETVRPPCVNGCTHPNGAPRLAELAGPRSGRPVCGPCAQREQRGLTGDPRSGPWLPEDRAAWADAERRDAARESGGGW